MVLGWKRLCGRLGRRRRNARPGGADPDYFKRLSEQAEAEDEPPSGRRG